MRRSCVKRLQGMMQNISKFKIPSGRKIFAAVIISDILAVTAALVMGKKPYTYFSESGFITYISFLQLAATAVLSYGLFKREHIKDEPVMTSSAVIWLIITAGFAYLALDEIIMIHEKIDMFIHWIFRMEETPVTDRIDDIVVALYGVIGFAVCIRYRSSILSRRSMVRYFIAGAVLMFLMATADIISNRDDIIRYYIPSPDTARIVWDWTAAIEDIFKIFAESMFLGGFLHNDK